MQKDIARQMFLGQLVQVDPAFACNLLSEFLAATVQRHILTFAAFGFHKLNFHTQRSQFNLPQGQTDDFVFAHAGVAGKNDDAPEVPRCRSLDLIVFIQAERSVNRGLFLSGFDVT